MDADTETILRQLDRRSKCANPWCETPVRVPGEFCAGCVTEQQRTRDELRRNQERAR